MTKTSSDQFPIMTAPNPPLRSWLRSNNVVLTSYGRTALYLALMAIGVRKKEVLIPAFTCATSLPPAILQAGGVPVFVDISTDTINMDPTRLGERLTSNSRVIISHHYYGSAASNMEEVQRFAAENRLIHIEDCTHSLGARCGGNEVGDIGDIAVFSFSKLLSCPGGGAVSFKDSSLFQRALEIQRGCANPFHHFVTDTEALRYESELLEDRPGSLRIEGEVKRSSLSGFVRRLLIKALCDCGAYRRGFARAMSPADVGMFRPGVDTRMTRLQESRIVRKMAFLDEVIRERRRKALILDEIMPAYFKDFESNVLMQYVTRHSKAEDLARYLRGHGIRIRRVWSYSQKCWPDQLTEEVKALRDELLLIDLDSVTEEALAILRRGAENIVSAVSPSDRRRVSA